MGAIEIQEAFTVTESSPGLLADAMLGKLARWLRLLGYDTLYLQGDDALLAHRARVEERILLTRDHALARRRGLRAIIIASETLAAQLAQVVAEVEPPPEASPRCMACNAPLTQISVEEARLYVPPYVAATQREFHRCPNCGKIYWKGTHWEGIRRQLDEALRQGSADDGV
jgi:hypothetical protein